MQTMLASSQHKNGRLLLRGWQLIYRINRTFFTDKLQFKSQVPRQVICWHSN
uniref:Uncharacterized protein n=1 Tax=Anguilla anguilla TaxID=7936 RepID=A0A0E9QDR2_ANGAN